MSYSDALESHLQLSLRKDLDLPCVHADPDGDYLLDVEGVGCWAKVLTADDGGPALVRVWSRAAVGVKRTLKVLGELNEANTGWTQIRCLWEGQEVFVVGELELESVEPGELGRLVKSVASKAQHLGELIAAVHGGTPDFAVIPAPELSQFDRDEHPPAAPTC